MLAGVCYSTKEGYVRRAIGINFLPLDFQSDAAIIILVNLLTEMIAA